MRLNDFTFPVNKLDVVAVKIRDQLRAAEDGSSVPLVINASVEIGIDAILNDYIAGITIESLCPAARIGYEANDYHFDAASGGAPWITAIVSIFFVYYVGVPSTDVSSSSFQTLRDAHILRNLNYLKRRIVAPYDTIGFLESDMLGWKFVENQIARVEHDVELQLGDKTFRMTGDFRCSRLDLEILVGNYST